YPFIEVEPRIFVCYDRAFHRRLFTDGIYWKLCDSLRADERKSFQSFFGKVFEKYVQRLLAFRTRNQTRISVYENPRYVGEKAEICDLLHEADNAWVLVEAKGTPLTTRAKYAGNAQALEDELMDKFVETKGRAPKGVGQLANSLRKLHSQ